MSIVNAETIRALRIESTNGLPGLTVSTVNGHVGVGITNPTYPFQTTGSALFNGQYAIDKYVGYWNDPGGYPEYMLIGRNNAPDVWKMIGQMYGVRGGAGERNVYFPIAASKTNFPSTSVNVGTRIGVGPLSTVSLTYAGNTWIALQSAGPGITGGMQMWFTGQLYNNYSVPFGTHPEFYGSTTSIPAASVSNVVNIATF